MKVAESDVGLAVDDVSFSIGALKILVGVTMRAERGRVTGLIGPNGAGKTTLLNCVSGLYRVTGGTISAGGKELQRLRCYEVARAGLGRTFQTPQVVESLNVIENVMLGGYSRVPQRVLRDSLSLVWQSGDERRLRSAALAQLQRVGMAGLADKAASVCTHIERRLIEVSRALTAEPHVLLLDEPCAGMGAEGRAILGEIIRTLAREGVTVLLVEHDVLFVTNISDHIAVLDQGQIIASGEPNEVINSQLVIDAYLGR